MAIRAIQLNRSVGTFQIMAQMNCMIQLDRSRIRAAGTNGGELGMSAVKTSNVMGEGGRWPVSTQICVALRTAGIRCGRETQTATMLLMARGTAWLEGLICVMNRAVVA